MEDLIEYPREWEFLIITSNKENLAREIESIIRDKKYTLNLSKINGKYASFKLNLNVESQSERDAIFAKLCEIKNVQMVI